MNTGSDDGWPVIKLLGTITDEGLAAERPRELYDQVHDHRPLNEIEVTP